MLAHKFFPLAMLNDLCDGMDRRFYGFKDGDFVPFLRHRAFPPVNVWEDENHLHVEVEVPGIVMNDLKVEVVGRELTIKGRREQVSEDDRTYHRKERIFEEFTRSFKLSTDVDSEQVEAVLKDGVLTVTLPKRPDARLRRIEVKTG